MEGLSNSAAAVMLVEAMRATRERASREVERSRKLQDELDNERNELVRTAEACEEVVRGMQRDSDQLKAELDKARRTARELRHQLEQSREVEACMQARLDAALQRAQAAEEERDLLLDGNQCLAHMVDSLQVGLDNLKAAVAGKRRGPEGGDSRTAAVPPPQQPEPEHSQAAADDSSRALPLYAAVAAGRAHGASSAASQGDGGGYGTMPTAGLRSAGPGIHGSNERRSAAAAKERGLLPDVAGTVGAGREDWELCDWDSDLSWGWERRQRALKLDRDKARRRREQKRKASDG